MEKRPLPNFVFIMTDTQATNMVECYSGQNLRTPNIDRLAKEGIKFENGYTTNPLCTPARAGIFTGIYSHTSGPWTNNLALGENIKTMGERFQNLGYQTPYIGKWHLDGHDYFGTGIPARGWDSHYWYDGKNYLDELDEHEIFLWRKGLNSLEDIKKHQITEEFTWGHRISNRGIEFLQERNPEAPFLLVLSYDEPHHPFTCPPEFLEPFEDFEYDLGPSAFDDLHDKPFHQQEWAQAKKTQNDDMIKLGTKVKFPLYFGCNSFVDYEIGRVIHAIDQYAPEETYIIYTSDHGEMMGAHKLWGKGCCMYNEITKVPYIIKPPQGHGAGLTIETPVSHIDFLPTMLELAGGEIPPILEGKSLVPMLTDLEENEGDEAVLIEFGRYEIEHDSFGGFKPVRCLVTQNYKLVINLLSSDELYDLNKDPHEMENLIHDINYRSIRDNLHERLIRRMYEKRDPFRAPEWERRPWQSNRTLTWMGKFRPRPEDGYAPMVRDYDTGMPTQGVKVEHSKG